MTGIDEKEEILKTYLQSLKKVAVAYSSGVDSTYLLKIAKKALGNRNVIAITTESTLVPERDILEAKEFCKKENIQHIILPINVFEIDGFSKNPKNRCYICKKTLFQKMKEVAQEEGFEELVEGSNMDDMGDYRPGLQAIKELSIKSPLQYAKLYKKEIRELSKKLDLQTWDKPSFACLASRFVYGEEITKNKLEMVDKAEQILLDNGFHQFRVRIHGKDMARIEVGINEIENLAQNEMRNKIVEEFKKIGFYYITLDLQGYKTGSMNHFNN